MLLPTAVFVRDLASAQSQLAAFLEAGAAPPDDEGRDDRPRHPEVHHLGGVRLVHGVGEDAESEEAFDCGIALEK